MTLLLHSDFGSPEPRMAAAVVAPSPFVKAAIEIRSDPSLTAKEKGHSVGHDSG